ncbi:hypothetical protein Bhyg_17914 [Pseudolycoriella hygida]|uniref:Uncharacterized protein n=1 Tax=Pseudolycoriella hygida TaxID=35572 RepID=A0A9Q0RUD3_9DIPT|nr:hypothetical protein Bhyg_17914 [Pseudolycoriella hygida]
MGHDRSAITKYVCPVCHAEWQNSSLSVIQRCKNCTQRTFPANEQHLQEKFCYTRKTCGRCLLYGRLCGHHAA